jgi:hypothetical protein
MKHNTKRFNIITASLITALTLSSLTYSSLTVKATETNESSTEKYLTTVETNEIENNIKKMTASEKSTFIKGLISDIINNSTTNIADYQESFTSDQLSNFLVFIGSNSISGTLVTSVIDEVTSSYSATSDTVLMCNFRLNIDNGYNNVFMMELHINNEGKIYGYNIWSV